MRGLYTQWVWIRERERVYILNGTGPGSVRGLYTQWDWIRERERVIYSMGLDQGA